MPQPKPPVPQDAPPDEDIDAVSPPLDANAENIFSGFGVPQDGHFRFSPVSPTF